MIGEKRISNYRLIVSLVALHFTSLIEPVFSQETSGFNISDRDLKPLGVQVSEGLKINKMIIDFESPTPGSPSGVYDQIPRQRTAFPDEMLSIEGKVILEVDVKEIREDFTIELDLNLEFRQIVGIDSRRYFSKVKDFKENRENLILSAIKEKLKSQRFQFGEFSDKELLENHSSPALEQAIEKNVLGLRGKVVSTSPVSISSTWSTTTSGISVIEIPFKAAVYSDQLEPRAVYIVAFSQEIPHEQKRVGMFYTVFARSVNF